MTTVNVLVFLAAPHHVLTWSRGVSNCSSLGWPDLYLGAKNSGWHNTWLSEWCNLTPAMRCHAVNTGIM